MQLSGVIAPSAVTHARLYRVSASAAAVVAGAPPCSYIVSSPVPLLLVTAEGHTSHCELQVPGVRV